MIRASALLAVCSSACSLAIDPPQLELCDGSSAPRCADGVLAVCERGYLIERRCARGCAASGTTCTPECGDGVVVAPEECDDGNRDDGDACDASCLATPDRVINATLEGSQGNPRVAAAPDGTFLVVYEDTSRTAPDPAGKAIRGALLTSDGARIGADFVVPENTAGDQSDPDVAGGQNNTYLIAWETDDQVRARFVASNGAFLSGEVEVAASTGHRPALAAAGDGSFIVVWVERSETFTGLRARLFGSDLLPRQAIAVVANEETDRPAVAAIGADRYLVVWERHVAQGATLVRGAFVRAGAVEGAAFAVSERAIGEQAQPVVTATAGAALVVWAEQPVNEVGAIAARFLNADGLGRGDTFLAARGDDVFGKLDNPTVATGADGSWLIVWETLKEPHARDEGGGVRMRRYTAGGEPIEALDVALNTTAVLEQGDPSVAAGLKGFFAVWEDESMLPPDELEEAIRGKLLPYAAR